MRGGVFGYIVQEKTNNIKQIIEFSLQKKVKIVY